MGEGGQKIKESTIKYTQKHGYKALHLISVYNIKEKNNILNIRSTDIVE